MNSIDLRVAVEKEARTATTLLSKRTVPRRGSSIPDKQKNIELPEKVGVFQVSNSCADTR